MAGRGGRDQAEKSEELAARLRRLRSSRPG
jgi:hypothetical protein